ncbi:sulfite exporter TauE/SafE family protein [Paracoccus fistulariae]|uniref:Probable membrane transporter protein n=1 Tax=Paracoccus fistulariae TaxID=658446 RepID=A0ABY7SIE4_9RHOB|nr:sulfite exporter TauE/SafE family protein [Paracoccus fistulariae]MDB6182156.1 sulfite exporter TauE/SafE family protein [Paracoccus fistulariae]WCR06619.1 sulfite exporter TauE/SafE family protein [Paracoccus fistulariae]
MFGLDPWQFWAIIAITGFAGFVKGAVGFAMPMIMMSAFSSILPAQTALACLIMPTLFTNIQQAFRFGRAEVVSSIRSYRWHIAMVLIFICVSAGFAAAIPQGWMYLMLGVPIVAFAVWQLSGRPILLDMHHRRRAEIVTGIIGGLYGGISGIWGPPLIVYLLSTGASKSEQMRVQGIVFLLGAIMLLVAHLFSGILNAQTLPLSLILCIPAFLGMQLGFALHDRMDVVQFRRWTLILLVITGLNLVRRAFSIGF